MIVDSTGRQMKTKSRRQAVVFASSDGENWEVVMPDEVPLRIKTNPDVMAYMMDGEIIETMEGRYYRAETIQ